MTSLQKQLAAIAASSTHQLDLKAQKAAHGKSLLYEPKVAASQSFDSIYLLCYEGFRELCALDGRFAQFARSLFSEQSKVEDRTQMTKKENEELDKVLEAFITLAGPRLLLKPAEMAMEWLVRRFRVHEYNTECLVFTYLPYHEKHQFQALLSILPKQPPPTLRFLHPYISSPTNEVPRRTIVYTAANTPGFFTALQTYVINVLQASHQGPTLLAFWSSITTQAINAIIDNSSSGRKEIQDQKTEEMLFRVLPVLNECMKLVDAPDAVIGCYMIIIVLVTKAAFEDKVLDSLMEAVILSQSSETLDSCLVCLAIIAEERSRLDFPAPVLRKVLTIPNLSQKFQAVSPKCRIERLALGCALGALEGIGSAARSEERRAVFQDIMELSILNDASASICLSVLIKLVLDGAPGSVQHGQLLDLVTQFSESANISKLLQAVVKKDGTDLESLGIVFQESLNFNGIDAMDSEDEEMIDIDEIHIPNGAPLVSPPDIAETSFLDTTLSKSFQATSEAFEQVVSSKPNIHHFLGSKTLRRHEAFQHPLFLSFMVRLWCGPTSVSVRIAAIRSTTALVSKFDGGIDLQILIPYLLCALADPSPIVRRSAAACIGAVSKNTSIASGRSTSLVWGSKDVYGKSSSQISLLQPDQTSELLSSVLIPILEECVIDSTFVTTSVRHILQGTQSPKSQHKNVLKASLKTSLLSFLGSHAALTPLLRARLQLLPLFNFVGKSTTGVRVNSILPIVRDWCSLSGAEVKAQCEREKINAKDADQIHLATLMARETESVQLLSDLISGNVNKDRTELQDAAFDRLNGIWPSLKSDSRFSFSQVLLDLSLKEDGTIFDELCRMRSLETLRNIKLDTPTLTSFLESVPAALQMPEGPPAKKRRRTSRTEIARVELQSPQDTSRLLRRLTLVLELVEGSNPGEHLPLFRNLFAILGELQQLKQQSGSDLVYLQSSILGSLAPIVNKLKNEQDPADYQASVRADLLIDCIRHSTSPQVQNGALLLIASLASWVPELVLHNLMPIFTFIGSTLLRQKDDYSAHVVDQTISRVVPQLAASLRARHKNFLTGVADLLLSFTAAFEHIPQHRRLKLFSELAETLGPRDSLSAIIALLVDRYPTGTTHRKFAIDLLLEFDPVVTLETFKGYLDLAVDAAGPKRKISDTLFGLNEKQPSQVENALTNLLSSLSEFAADEKLKGHVGKAFRRKAESTAPREIFASIVDTTIQLSKKVVKSPENYKCCSRVLAKCLALLPTPDLIKSTEILLANPDRQVQVAAIKSIELRAGTVLQNDQGSVSALLAFLPSLEELLQQTQEMDVKAIVVSCIDRIVERFGKKDVNAVAAVARTISSSYSLASGDDRVHILSLLCLTSIVDVLEDEAISLLPIILPAAFDYLKEAIEQENTGLHNAVYALLSNIVERLAYMFSREYMIPALKLSQRSAASLLDEACDESRNQFYQSISKHLGAQEAFTAIRTTWPDAIGHGYEASQEQLDLILSTIESQTKSQLIKTSPTLFGLLLEVFDLRGAIDSRPGDESFDDDELEKLEDCFIESVLGMTLKLNDATFRPFFIQLVDLASTSSKLDMSRSITFCKFLAAFFEKFKSIVTSYSSYIVEHIAHLLEYLSKGEGEPELRSAVLNALQKTFQHDQDGFWQAPSHYGAIMPPLLKQLTINSPSEVTDSVIPAITDLAAASSSSVDNHREMSGVLLKYMRSEDAHTRLATVKCEQSLTQRLGEEWLGLLPEMLPFISELREDDDEMVERETQRWITMMEEILSEDLDAMLQ
ncbi:U3 small nucleolar RNA-associated protein 10 [Melanomma pulvis-pyrius CBS 109.77]|uniref:U3 small nucleolar RNA-associated protein 10 n=1 Tax=Melanomma pulvis-pyrius CBS 109.77 TaxID=1314802 RepID=A0A6A6WW29_9PLEO|nr:U3 small nucleolar RNA-associated protein 10 [Melanomma pulvis-pyrius CBS 109.77]